MATTRTIQYSGASDDDRAHLLNEVVHPYSLLVCKDREWERQHWLGAKDFDQLPEYGYVALQNRKYAPVITVDVDEDFDPERLSALAFTPNWVGVNAVSMHYQLIMYLDAPVFGNGASRKHYNVVQRGLTRVLDGDNHFARNLARNPLSNSGEYEWHLLHHESHSIPDLHAAAVQAGSSSLVIQKVSEKAMNKTDYGKKQFPELRIQSLPLSLATLAEPTYDSEGLQRDQFLFKAGRSEAYRLRGLGYEIDESYMFTRLSEINDEIGRIDPRGPNEVGVVISTARSITSWVNTNMKPGVRGSGNGPRPYTHDQCVQGGKTQGPRNTHLAGLPNDGRKKGAEHSRLIRGAGAMLDAEQIRTLRAEGMRPVDIKDETGFSRSKISEALKTWRPSEPLQSEPSETSSLPVSPSALFTNA